MDISSQVKITDTGTKLKSFDKDRENRKILCCYKAAVMARDTRGLKNPLGITFLKSTNNTKEIDNEINNKEYIAYN